MDIQIVKTAFSHHLKIQVCFSKYSNFMSNIGYSSTVKVKHFPQLAREILFAG